MDFALSDEQKMAQDALARFLEKSAGLARTRRFAAERERRAQDVIDGLAALGVAGILVPETYGGSGLGVLDAALVSEQLGRFVSPAPFIGTTAIAPLALAWAGSETQKQRWLGAIAQGKAICGVALSELAGAREDAGVERRDGRLYGRAQFVLDFDADLYLVADRTRSLFLVDPTAPGLTRTPFTTIDATRPTGELVFDAVAGEALGGASSAMVQKLLAVGRAMVAADTLGAAQSMLDQAVAYAKQRKQFDRAIASFQAVKHMCAEMAAALEPCRALVWMAAYSLDALPQDAALNAAHAKAHLAEVGAFVARTATEVHGGMGFTDLLGLHYWFKRIGFNRQILGGPIVMREEAARLQGLVA